MNKRDIPTNGKYSCQHCKNQFSSTSSKYHHIKNHCRMAQIINLTKRKREELKSLATSLVSEYVAMLEEEIPDETCKKLTSRKLGVFSKDDCQELIAILEASLFEDHAEAKRIGELMKPHLEKAKTQECAIAFFSLIPSLTKPNGRVIEVASELSKMDDHSSTNELLQIFQLFTLVLTRTALKNKPHAVATEEIIKLVQLKLASTVSKITRLTSEEAEIVYVAHGDGIVEETPPNASPLHQGSPNNYFNNLFK